MMSPTLPNNELRLPESQQQHPGTTVDNGNSRTISLRPRTEKLPLSFAQQRIWILHNLDPESAAYNCVESFRLVGPLDVAALKRSLKTVVDRHEVLRTRFENQAGSGTQIIAPELEVEVAEIDLSALSPQDRDAEVSRLGTEHLVQHFDLSRLPLFRVSLLRLADENHLLLLTIHHIVFDGWSVELLLQELVALYKAFSLGQSASLDPLPIQYADFACWQREWLRGEKLQKQLAYWKEQLAGELSSTELTTDYARPAVQTFNGAIESLELESDLVTRLKVLGARQNASVFMTVLAAFNILLHRYTNQTDIIVGTPIAGRNEVETEKLIGFFVNTLALRTSLDGDPTFVEVLKRVRATALGAYDHQDVPFEKLVEDLQPSRSMSHTPFFQIMFQLRDLPKRALAAGGIEIERQQFDRELAKFDITLSLTEKPGRLSADLVYNSDLFEPATIRTFLKHYRSLLETVVKDPNCRCSELSLLSNEELRQQLIEWNTVKTPYPRNSCIHQLFEEQVEANPESIAVVFAGEELSYAQLNSRANRIANYLRRHGVGPEVVVGLSVERSLAAVVGMLAILKAGGGYLPFDPSAPRERVAQVLEDARPTIVVTSRRRQANFAGYDGRLVLLDQDDEFRNESAANPTPVTSAENLAYVMYTSGSVGGPKGVCVTHRNVVRLVKETNYVQFGASEVFLQLASLAFDAATFEIWGSLLNGARLVIAPSHELSLTEIGTLIREHKVSTLWLTAGLFHLMVDERVEDLVNVHQLLAGGDVVSSAHVRKLLQHSSNVRFINGYGPTENTTFTCCHTVTNPDQLTNQVPIGRPIANTKVYLLDSNLRPVPVGVPGELCAGGDGVARGYLNRPELTRERFVPNPFANGAGGQLYKTGDIARYRSDGTIEFLGRIDDQLKIRGFRIEPAEIEAALLEHPAICEALVTANPDLSGSKQLAAYFVCESGQSVTAAELRGFLKPRLPDYMVPSVFMTIESFPLTSNGKVDRSALPAPTVSGLQGSYVAPQNAREKVLTDVWRQVFGYQEVGVNDNFFELGGHSLLGIQMMSRVRERFNVDLPLRILFEAPTVASLAQLLPEKGEASNIETSERVYPPALVPIQPTGTNKPVFFLMASGEESQMLSYANLFRRLGPDQPTLGILPPRRGQNGGPLDVEGMAAECVAQLREFLPQGPYYLVGYCAGGVVMFEIARQLTTAGDQVGMLLLIDVFYPVGVPEHLGRVNRRFLSHFYGRIKHHLQELPKLSFRERFSYLTGRARAIGNLVDERGTPADGYLKAIGHYEPKPYAKKLVLFVTDKLYKIDPTMGWSKYAQGGLEIIKINGDHLSCIRDDAQLTAQRIKACLEQSR